jgi:DNA-binding beta-propeller fold protein YncE
MKNYFKFLLSCIIGLSFFNTYAQKLELKWKTDTLLRVPESVLFDNSKKVLYVANIDGNPEGKDGAGFISKVGLNGKIENLKWVTGLDAPKGMGLFGSTLYVADISRVVVIDIPSGKITGKIEIEGAKFLNDITVDKKGIVYISDTNTGKIHSIKNNKAELYFESSEFKGINGLLALANEMYVVDFGTGANYKLSADKKLVKFGTTSEGADGVVPVGNGDFLVSSWHGEVYYVTAKGESTKLLDTKDQKISAADIEFDAKSKMLFIPTFFANSVVAYELKK